MEENWILKQTVVLIFAEVDRCSPLSNKKLSVCDVYSEDLEWNRDMVEILEGQCMFVCIWLNGATFII